MALVSLVPRQYCLSQNALGSEQQIADLGGHAVLFTRDWVSVYMDVFHTRTVCMLTDFWLHANVLMKTCIYEEMLKLKLYVHLELH